MRLSRLPLNVTSSGSDVFKAAASAMLISSLSIQGIFGRPGRVSVQLGTDKVPPPDATLVTWTFADDSPYYCVEPWMGPRSLPLWLEMPSWAGLNSHDTSRAIALGLSARPLDETLDDTLTWELDQGVDRPRRAGLTSHEERLLLKAFDGVR